MHPLIVVLVPIFFGCHGIILPILPITISEDMHNQSSDDRPVVDQAFQAGDLKDARDQYHKQLECRQPEES